MRSRRGCGGGERTSGRPLRSSPRAGCARSISRCRSAESTRTSPRSTSALRANGIAVSCLGGDPTWAVEHDAALNWAFRATADAVFDGVHLDVEPWALPRWPEDAAALMASYSVLVEEMTEVAPLAVDLAPWLVDAHRDVVSRVVRQCDSVTVLAYRDGAASIVADGRRDDRDLCVAGASLPNRCGDAAAVVIDTEQDDIRRRRRGGAAPGARRGRQRTDASILCSTGSPFTTSAPGERMPP